MAIPKVMGTEIEYGITVKGDADFDPISGCVLLVNAYREDHAGVHPVRRPHRPQAPARTVRPL